MDFEDSTMIKRGPEPHGPAPAPAEGQKAKQYLAGFCATMGALAAGTVLGWTSPAMEILKSNETSPLTVPATNEEGSWIGGLMPLGAFLGALVAGVLADTLGRKMTIALLSAPFTLSWVLIVFATNVAMLYAARFIGGMATGATSVVATMYAAEIGEVSIKGTLGSFFQLQVTVGILLANVLGAITSYTGLAVASGVIPVVWLVTVLFLPETPVYLLSKRRASDAERSLRWLRGPAYDVKWELNQLQKAADEAARNKASVKDLFQSPACRKALVICLGLMIFQQITGVNAITFYTKDIFTQAGSSLSPTIAVIIVGVVMVVVTFVTALIVDKAGRRILLLGSALVMAICLGVLGVYFHMKDSKQDVSSLGWLPLLCVVLYVVVFSMGFGPIPWMMTGELFTASVQGPASGIAASVNWIMAFAVTKLFSNLVDAMGTAGAFWLFAGFAVAAVVFVLTLVFETKGKTQAEIQTILGGEAPAVHNGNRTV